MSPEPAHSAFSLIPCLFFSCYLLPHVAVLSAELYEGNTRIRDCYLAHCGGVVIRYPFRLDEEANASYCGYPSLEIVCQNEHPALKLGVDSYRVAHVDDDGGTVTLQDIDVRVSDCPSPRHNVFLRLDWGGPWSYTNTDVGLFFHFNCSDDLPDYNSNPCLSDNTGYPSYVFLQDTILFERHPWEVCEDSEVAPILKTKIAADVKELWSSITEIRQDGFQLWWPPPETDHCKSCENTGGNCGYVYIDNPGLHLLLQQRGVRQ